MPQINLLEHSPFNSFHIVKVLEELNKYFDPSLETRIIDRSHALTFRDYVKKVLKQGKIIVQYEKEIEGVIMFYDSNLKDLSAYISLVLVRPPFQRRGVAKSLLQFTISYLEKGLMEKINIKTWKKNEAALSLYKKSGFLIVKEDMMDVILTMNLGKDKLKNQPL